MPRGGIFSRIDHCRNFRRGRKHEYIHILFDIVHIDQIWVVIIVFRIIRHQTEFRLVPNKSEECNCKANLVYMNNIKKYIYLFIEQVSERYFCSYSHRWC